MKEVTAHSPSQNQIRYSDSIESVEHEGSFVHKQINIMQNYQQSHKNNRVEKRRSLIDQLFEFSRPSLELIVEQSIQDRQEYQPSLNPSIQNMLLDSQYSDASTPNTDLHPARLRDLHKNLKQTLSIEMDSPVRMFTQEQEQEPAKLFSNKPFLRKKALSTFQRQHGESNTVAPAIKNHIMKMESQFLELKHQNDSIALIADELTDIVKLAQKSASISRTVDNENGFSKFKELLAKQISRRFPQ